MYYLVTSISNTVTVKAKSEHTLTKYKLNLACVRPSWAHGSSREPEIYKHNFELFSVTSC